jgi:predicted nucleotidyltransferase/uncharacterized protein (UPF0332 family)
MKKKRSDSKSDSKHSKKSEKKGKEEVGVSKITNEKDIALDFATKAYKIFDKLIKSVVLFGSTAKNTAGNDSDIDIIMIIDDVAIQWDDELIGWYRNELRELLEKNKYKKPLHVNSVKLSTWWDDMLRGDPVVVNVIRYGESLVDFGGFFEPLKVMLMQGKIKSTPEAIYTLLQRAPHHISRTRVALLSAIDGLYWAMVDSAHAALIAADISPPSPEHLPLILKETFADKKMLDKDFVEDYIKLHALAKDIVHGKKIEVNGEEVDEWMKKTDEFVSEMAKLVDKIIDIKYKAD